MDELRNNDALPLPLKVLIIGGGLSGCATAIALRKGGHSVTVFERMPSLQQVGAGIQLPPNATKILSQWGIMKSLEEWAYQPAGGTLRSYKGDVLSQQGSASSLKDIFGSPYLVIHRTDLLNVIVAEAQRLGVVFKVDANVSAIDFRAPSITLSAGETYYGDLILAADGERSICRATAFGRRDLTTASGDVVYRLAVPKSRIDSEQQCWELFCRPSVNVWMGPNSHAVSYLLKRDDLVNVVLITRDKRSEVPFGPQPADLDEVREEFGQWDPTLADLLTVTGLQCTKWSLLQTSEVSEWVHPSGKFALIGDAAHAILPYLAQGAAQAFEDAATIGVLFSRIRSSSQIPNALKAYEQLRKPRSTKVREQTLKQKIVYSMENGAEQEKRDRCMMGLEAGEQNPNLLAQPLFLKWLWGHDSVAEAERVSIDVTL